MMRSKLCKGLLLALSRTSSSIEDAERLPSPCCAVEDLMEQNAVDESAEAEAEDNTRPTRIENHCRSSYPATTKPPV
jgi:hypothetical protein